MVSIKKLAEIGLLSKDDLERLRPYGLDIIKKHTPYLEKEFGKYPEDVLSGVLSLDRFGKLLGFLYSYKRLNELDGYAVTFTVGKVDSSDDEIILNNASDIEANISLQLKFKATIDKESIEFNNELIFRPNKQGKMPKQLKQYLNIDLPPPFISNKDLYERRVFTEGNGILHWWIDLLSVIDLAKTNLGFTKELLDFVYETRIIPENFMKAYLKMKLKEAADLYKNSLRKREKFTNELKKYKLLALEGNHYLKEEEIRKILGTDMSRRTFLRKVLPIAGGVAAAAAVGHYTGVFGWIYRFFSGISEEQVEPASDEEYSADYTIQQSGDVISQPLAGLVIALDAGHMDMFKSNKRYINGEGAGASSISGKIPFYYKGNPIAISENDISRGLPELFPINELKVRKGGKLVPIKRSSLGAISEQAVNASIVNELGRLLTGLGANVVYMQINEKFPEFNESTHVSYRNQWDYENAQRIRLLKKRYQKARNAGAECIVSIHANGFKDPKQNGFFCMTAPSKGGKEKFVRADSLLVRKNESNSGDGLRFRRSNKLAVSITRNLELSGIGIRKHGKNTDFMMSNKYLLRQKIPAVIVETGYMTNRHDMGILAKEGKRKEIAQAIAEGVVEYHFLEKLEDKDIKKIAIVVDDIEIHPKHGELPGQKSRNLTRLLEMGKPLTYAILPRDYATTVFSRIINSNSPGEAILHQPMEYEGQAKNNRQRRKISENEPDRIMLTDKEEDIRRRLNKNIVDVFSNRRAPLMAGLNNHEGSEVTKNPDKMFIIMNYVKGNCKKDDIYFLNSSTDGSAALRACRRAASDAGIGYCERNVDFLDWSDRYPKGDADREKYTFGILQGIITENRPAGNHAVAIGHVQFKATVNAIKRFTGQFKEYTIDGKKRFFLNHEGKLFELVICSEIAKRAGSGTA